MPNDITSNTKSDVTTDVGLHRFFRNILVDTLTLLLPKTLSCLKHFVNMLLSVR